MWKLLISQPEQRALEYFEDPETFTELLNNTKDFDQNNDQYKPKKNLKILIYLMIWQQI